VLEENRCIFKRLILKKRLRILFLTLSQTLTCLLGRLLTNVQRSPHPQRRRQRRPYPALRRPGGGSSRACGYQCRSMARSGSSGGCWRREEDAVVDNPYRGTLRRRCQQHPGSAGGRWASGLPQWITRLPGCRHAEGRRSSPGTSRAASGSLWRSAARLPPKVGDRTSWGSSGPSGARNDSGGGFYHCSGGISTHLPNVRNTGVRRLMRCVSAWCSPTGPPPGRLVPLRWQEQPVRPRRVVV
jgi:hypothetical protein